MITNKEILQALVLGLHNKKIAELQYNEYTDLIDIGFTLYEQLVFAAEYIFNNKNSNFIYHNALSLLDKNIIKKVVDDPNTKYQCYWKSLLSRNYVEYNDGLLTKLNNDANIIKLYDRKSIQYISKWFNLNGSYSSDIVNSIMNSKVYLSSPMISPLNDFFDCQFNLCDDTIQEIAQKTKKSKIYIQHWMDIINMIPSIASFSLIDPLDYNSQVMWGTYGNNDSSIAVTYNINEIIHNKFTFDDQYRYSDVKTKSRISTLFKHIEYFSNVTNRHYTNLISLLENISRTQTNDTEKLKDDFFKLMLDKSTGIIVTKDTNWCHERELRIARINYYFTSDTIQKDYPLAFTFQINEEQQQKTHNLFKELLRKNESYASFVKPATIILGSRYEINKLNSQLVNWSISNNVPIKQLTGRYDYKDNKFEVNEVIL